MKYKEMCGMKQGKVCFHRTICLSHFRQKDTLYLSKIVIRCRISHGSEHGLKYKAAHRYITCQPVNCTAIQDGCHTSPCIYISYGNFTWRIPGWFQYILYFHTLNLPFLLLRSKCYPIICSQILEH